MESTTAARTAAGTTATTSQPTSGAVVVLVTDDVGVEDTRGGIKGIDGGINAQLGDASRQDGRRVQMGEGRRGGRVGQIVGRHVNGLRMRGGRN